MSRKRIPLDKAELLSVLLEGILYGFSLLMFGGTIWILVSQRSTGHVNRRILTVACLLLLISTTHLVINIIRLMDGFILYGNTHPGGPVAYFANVSRWTFVFRHYTFTAQTLLGDGVVLYRCYVVWQSKLVMILPTLLWCAVGVFGFGSSYLASHVRIFTTSRSLLLWVTLFWASSLVTNLLSTLMLAYRIWNIDRKVKRTNDYGKSQLRHILYIIIDAGIIYSLAIFAALISFLCRTNFRFDMISPIISITFYMVIIRVGLANRAKQPISIPLEYTSADSTDPRPRMQVHITRLTESKVENGHPLSRTPVNSEDDQRESKPNYIGEVMRGR